jgi:hypothetical protein
MTTEADPETDPVTDPKPAEPPKVEDPPKPTEPKPSEPTVTLYEEELKRKMAREKQQGSEGALAKLAKELDMPIEDAKAVIADHRKREEDSKSELQKLTDENARLKAEKDSEVAAAKQEQHIDRVKARLLRPGLLPKETAESDEALDRIVGLIKAPTGASVEDIDADIESGLKVQFPQLFASTEPPAAPGTPSGVPSGTPRKPALGESREEKAKRMADASNRSRGIPVATN